MLCIVGNNFNEPNANVPKRAITLLLLFESLNIEKPIIAIIKRPIPSNANLENVVINEL